VTNSVYRLKLDDMVSRGFVPHGMLLRSAAKPEVLATVSHHGEVSYINQADTYAAAECADGPPEPIKNYLEIRG
jgi:hypothetical protein